MANNTRPGLTGPMRSGAAAAPGGGGGPHDGLFTRLGFIGSLAAYLGFAPKGVVVSASLFPTVAVEVYIAGSWVDLIADVQREDAIHIIRGIQGSGPSDLVAPSGTATFSLRNDARNSASTLGYYSPYHASKRAGWDLNIACRIRMRDPASLAWRTQFVGVIREIDPLPGLHLSRRVRVTAVDWMDTAATWALTPDIGPQINKRGDEILTAILAQMPVQPVATNFDAGTEIYPYALDQSASAKQAALTEFAKLAASEYGPIYLTADGTLRYENRHRRILNGTPAWTMDDNVLVADDDGLTIPTSLSDIKNTIRVTTHERKVDALPTSIVYEQTNPIRIEAGETKFLLGPFRDQVTGDPIGATDVQVPLVAITNYLFNADQHGVDADLTVNLTVTPTIGAAGVSFSLVNAGESGWLTRLRLYGRAIKDHGTVDHDATDAGSVAAYGEHVALIDMPYQTNTNVGQAAAIFIRAKFGVPSAKTVRVRGKSTAIVTQMLTREISDRITVQETVTGIDDDFFINGVELTVLPSGHLETTYVLAPTTDPPVGGYWLVGTSVLGVDTVPAPY